MLLVGLGQGRGPVQEDKTKLWYAKMPPLDQLGDTSLVAPELRHLEESESDMNEYMLEPTDPVVCLPDQDDPDYWVERRSADECKYVGPGSTMNFWAQSSFIDRITLGVKMHSTAAFLSMPQREEDMCKMTLTRFRTLRKGGKQFDRYVL